MDKFNVFEVRSVNEELEAEFHNFFKMYNLEPLFTDEHRMNHSITVSDNELRATINTNGKYHDTLKEFSNFLSQSQDNKAYERAVYKILFMSKSMQGLVNNIKSHMDYIKSLPPEKLFNLWNIVYYDKQK